MLVCYLVLQAFTNHSDIGTAQELDDLSDLEFEDDDEDEDMEGVETAPAKKRKV